MDALVGLTILTTLSISILPLYTLLYEKRIITSQRVESLTILDGVWTDYVLLHLPPPTMIEKETEIYMVDLEHNRLCVKSQNGKGVCRSLPHGS